MIHEEYTGKIGSYVEGIEHDLESVIPKEGHDLVKDSIAEQAKRLADYDCWDRVSHEQLMEEFEIYLKWGLDAVNHFDDKPEEK